MTIQVLVCKLDGSQTLVEREIPEPAPEEAEALPAEEMTE